MLRINWQELGRNIWRTMKRKSPELLTGFGIAGMLTTTVLAVKATPEALRRIEATKDELQQDKLTPVETVKATWKCYIPAGVTGVISTGCLIGASVTSGRRNVALATAASIAETSLLEYRNKVVETIGERKEESILDAIDKDRVEKNPPPQAIDDIPIAEGAAGMTLCYDSWNGGYFYSNVDILQNAMHKLNRQMSTMTEPYVSLNEFYMEIGRQTVDNGEMFGWNVNRDLIELRFSSQLVNGRIPCLVMSHLNPPYYDYMIF